LVSDLERQWSITVGDPFSGGSASYVCRAVTRDGDDAVLKLSLPDDGFQDAARLLEVANGNGYVRHPGNALRVPTPRTGAESGFVFVDPDGFLADPAYDLGVVLRGWSQQLLAGDTSALARGYCRLLATETGVDETAIWEWGFLERVSTGLYAMQFASPAFYQPFLETAERLCQ